MGDVISGPVEAAGVGAAVTGCGERSITGESDGGFTRIWLVASEVLSVILKPSRSILKTATPFFFMRSMSERISLISTVRQGFY